MTTKETTRPASSSARWEHWQSTPVAERLLPLEARAEGYTVVRVPRQTREVFLDVVWLLIAYARVARRHPPAPEAQGAWQEWQTWTRRLRAYLERVAEDRPATVPLVPCGRQKDGMSHDAAL